MADRIIPFHRSLYLLEAIQAASEAYGAYGSIEIQAEPTEIQVSFTGFDPRYGEMLYDAFSNHALFETVVRARETLGGVPM